MLHKNFIIVVKMMTVGLLTVFYINTASAHESDQTALLVGVGTVSTDAREFATSLSPDGKALYFNRSDIPGINQIWVSKKHAIEWGVAAKVWFSDNRYADVDPFVSRSGDRLYFSSDRPLPKATDATPTVDYNTWYAPMVNGAWAQPVYGGPTINSDADEVFISESANGQVLFARFGEGQGRARPTKLIIAQRNGEGFIDLQHIITSPASLRLSNPAISPDGKMIVAAGLAGGKPNLFYSRKTEGGDWQEFRLLPAPINHPDFGQFAPYIANDGKTLYFSSDRPADGADEDNVYRAGLPAQALNQH